MYELEDEVTDIHDGVVDHQEEEELETDEYEEDENDSDVDDLEGEELEDEIDENGEVVEPEESEKQSPKENAQFKRMRLKAEEQANKKVEAQRKELEVMKQNLQQETVEKRIKDEMLTLDNIYEYADREGVTEETAKKLLQYEAQKKIDAQKVTKAENFNVTQEAKSRLKKSKYFNLLEKDVDDVLVEYPSAKFEDVYKHMLGDRIANGDLEKKLSSSVERQTIANIHARSKRRNIGGSSGGSDDAVNPSRIVSEQGLEMAGIFGTDPRKLAKYVKENTKKKGR